MANISKVYDETLEEYRDIEDAQAREDIGDLSDLITANKDNLVAAINEASQSGGGGGEGGTVTSVNGKIGAVVLTASDVGALPGNTSIPSKTSDLTNDSGFVASSSLASVATSGSYNDLSNKPTIPTTSSTVTAGGTNPVNSVAVIAYINSLDATNTSY